MTQSQVARLFRSPELARLAGLAAAQGWDVSRLPGGHVAATSPTGARVLMSGTGYVNHGTLRAKVHEFVQAGLDPDWTRKSARRRRQEVATMHVREVPPAEAATLVPVKNHDHTPAGGKFRMLGSWEVLTLAGQEVRMGLRADGQWVVRHRDATIKRGERTWYGTDREALVARVLVALTQEGLAPVATPEPEPEGRLDRVASAWHVAHVEASEFPIAAALDALDAAVAPAITALRAAGKSDAADLIAVEGGPTTPVERELLALYRRVLRGD